MEIVPEHFVGRGLEAFVDLAAGDVLVGSKIMKYLETMRFIQILIY